MDYTTLGRTGLMVSRMGLGCGGPSRLGLKTDGTEASAEAVVREAIDLGVNFIDTAEAYGTEEVVGRAIRNVPREQVILSTKASNIAHLRENAASLERPALSEPAVQRLRQIFANVDCISGN